MSKLFIGILIVFMFSFMFYLVTQIRDSPSIDLECLRIYAKTYCNENNMSYNSLYIPGKNFYCTNFSQERIKGTPEKRYKFITDEWKSCLVYNEQREDLDSLGEKDEVSRQNDKQR